MLACMQSAPNLTDRRIRELAVRADCDPRTLMRALATRAARSDSGRRALAVLAAEGLIPATERAA